MLSPVFGRGAGCVLFCLLLAGCAGGPGRSMVVPGNAPVLSAESILAPVDGSTQYDLERLAQSSDPAARLRYAWILLQRRQPQAAIDQSATVLYGKAPPSTQVEALARYIRAEAFDALGESARGEYDRQRVLELAIDPRLRARLTSPTTTAARPAPAAAGAELAVAVLPRANWRPAPPVGSRLDPMGRVYRITVHHSAMLFRDTSTATAAGQLRVIQKNHMQDPERRYGDIGYHFLIDPAGRVWEGRSLEWQGAHARLENNRGNIGICVLGNFIQGRDGQRPTAAELRSLSDLITTLAQRYGIGQDQIFCHSDFVKTECPGPLLEPEVARIARSLAHRKATAPSAALLPRAE